MNLLNTIVAFVVALGSLIVVHEFGHYLVARLCDVKVLRFSVGFGRVLAAARLGRDQTEWALAAFPLGGYVKMLDEREGEVARPSCRARSTASRCRRASPSSLPGRSPISCSRSSLYWLLFMPACPGMKPVIGACARVQRPRRRSLAAGEISIASVGEAVATWQDVRWLLLKHAVTTRSRSDSRCRTPRRDSHAHVSICRALSPTTSTAIFCARSALRDSSRRCRRCIGQVIAGGAAERAGLGPGDGSSPSTASASTRWDDVVADITRHPGRGAAVLVDQTRRDASRVSPSRPTRSSSNGSAHRPHRRCAAQSIADCEVHGRQCATRRRRALARRSNDLGDLRVQPAACSGKMVDRRSVAEEPERARSRSPTTPASRRSRVDLRTSSSSR